MSSPFTRGTRYLKRRNQDLLAQLESNSAILQDRLEILSKALTKSTPERLHSSPQGRKRGSESWLVRNHSGQVSASLNPNTFWGSTPSLVPLTSVRVNKTPTMTPTKRAKKCSDQCPHGTNPAENKSTSKPRKAQCPDCYCQSAKQPPVTKQHGKKTAGHACVGCSKNKIPDNSSQRRTLEEARSLLSYSPESKFLKRLKERSKVNLNEPESSSPEVRGQPAKKPGVGIGSASGQSATKVRGIDASNTSRPTVITSSNLTDQSMRRDVTRRNQPARDIPQPVANPYKPTTAPPRNITSPPVPRTYKTMHEFPRSPKETTRPPPPSTRSSSKPPPPFTRSSSKHPPPSNSSYSKPPPPSTRSSPKHPPPSNRSSSKHLSPSTRSSSKPPPPSTRSSPKHPSPTTRSSPKHAACSPDRKICRPVLARLQPTLGNNTPTPPRATNNNPPPTRPIHRNPSPPEENPRSRSKPSKHVVSPTKDQPKTHGQSKSTKAKSRATSSRAVSSKKDSRTSSTASSSTSPSSSPARADPKPSKRRTCCSDQVKTRESPGVRAKRSKNKILQDAPSCYHDLKTTPGRKYGKVYKPYCKKYRRRASYATPTEAMENECYRDEGSPTVECCKPYRTAANSCCSHCCCAAATRTTRSCDCMERQPDDWVDAIGRYRQSHWFDCHSYPDLRARPKEERTRGHRDGVHRLILNERLFPTPLPCTISCGQCNQVGDASARPVPREIMFNPARNREAVPVVLPRARRVEEPSVDAFRVYHERKATGGRKSNGCMLTHPIYSKPLPKFPAPANSLALRYQKGIV